ncbi:hypothetical protein, partial [Klebsiella quasipneumoniae]
QTETEATGAPQKHHYTLNQQVGSITDIAKESSGWKTLTNGSAMLKEIFIGSITLLKGTQ